MSSSKYANDSAKGIQRSRNQHKNGVFDSSPTSLNNENSAPVKTPIDLRIEHMNSYLRHVFVALSMSQSSLDGIVTIYELLAHKVATTAAATTQASGGGVTNKAKKKANDYVIQMLLATLWDGIVHMSLYVRCNTAKLFEVRKKERKLN